VAGTVDGRGRRNLERRLSGVVGVLVKRSFTLAGHRTSVALEPEFWQALGAFAEHRGRSVAAVVSEVDAARPPERPLASALRVHALTVWRSQTDAGKATR
jgi:predicted DNA-binding ribbon-helix-helix protein